MFRLDDYSRRLYENSLRINQYAVERAVEILGSCRNKGGVIYPIGNGHDASIGEILAKDLEPQGFVTVNLFNSGVLTALANDYGFDEIFVRQLKGRINERDVLIPLSSSGNSENVLRAVELALERRTHIIAITGGGRLLEMFGDGDLYEMERIFEQTHPDYDHIKSVIIATPGQTMQEVEDLQHIFIHYFVDRLRVES